MSRIELDSADRGSVERVRVQFAESERLDTGVASRTELAAEIGRLRGLVDILLRVIDGGES